MRKIVGLFLILNAALLLNAQDRKKDSLLRLLPTAREDTSKVMLLLKLADIYETNNQDSSELYLEESRKLSESLRFSRGMYHFYEQSAIVFFTKGDYSRSMEQSEAALKLARQLKDSSYVINILNNIAIVYAYLGDFESQVNYSIQVKDAVEGIKDSAKLSPVYHNLANAYYNFKQYRRSADYALFFIEDLYRI